MARLSPQPYREVKRSLEAAGFREISQKGSHVKFIRRGESAVDTAIVPGKAEIPVGTLRSILNTVENGQVTREEFLYGTHFVVSQPAGVLAANWEPRR